MKQLYSIIRVTNPETEQFCIVACETQQDETDNIRNAEGKGFKVTMPLGGYPNDPEGIYLNDFTL